MIRLFALVLAACLLSAAEPAPATPLLDRVIALNLVQEPELDRAVLRQGFAELCAKVRPEVAAAADAHGKIAVLNRILLAERKVSYLSNLYWRDATLAAAVLRGQANCLGTSTLYVLAGEELGLPIRMVIVPRHAFVRWDDGSERINIETTAGGREIPDAYYLREIEPAEALAMRYGSSLDRDGFLAELTEAAMHHRYAAGDLAEARTLLLEVERLAPWRADLRLSHIAINADITKDRQAARQQIVELLQQDPPDSVATGALCWLAEDAGARQQPQQQREILLQAFKRAPRSQLEHVLQSLAFCHRTLKDWRGAVRYYELVLACTDPGDPALAGQLYNYAILLKNDGRIPDALTAIDQALRKNPESWNLQVLKAGYLCLSGRMDEGKALFTTVKPPRADAEFWANMQAWFCAVSGQREEFYRLFAAALASAHSERVLNWIEQDVDLDRYRGEPEFQRLLDQHRPRLLGEKP